MQADFMVRIEDTHTYTVFVNDIDADTPTEEIVEAAYDLIGKGGYSRHDVTNEWFEVDKMEDSFEVDCRG